jgi:hypothetical protein
MRASKRPYVRDTLPAVFMRPEVYSSPPKASLRAVITRCPSRTAMFSARS